MTSSERTPRWFERVLPVTGLALVLIALAALAVPALRDQVALSATHRPEPYVELAFARAPAGTRVAGTPVVCTSSARTVTVRFAITSHLPDPEDLDYHVSVGGAATAGSRTVDPGETVEIARSFERPERRYDVAVRLPGLDQQLSAHCPAARGARS